MKKLVTKMLCGVLLSSVMLSGCSQVTETTMTSGTESQTEATTTATEPVQTTADNRPEINVDNMMKIADLYASKEPDGTNSVSIMSDDVRGSAAYSIHDGGLHFSYHASNGSSIQTYIMSGKRTMQVTISLEFKGMKSNLLLTGEPSIDGMESFIDAVIANDTEKFHVYNDQTLDAYAEQIKKDLPILYSRFIVLSDKAFPELGIGLKDVGVRLGAKYRLVDPKETTSTESAVTNPLTYKNGVSTKNKKVWTEYYYNAVGKMGDMKGKGWRSAYGRKSTYMITPNDYVQYSASNKKSGELFYYKSTSDDKDPGESLTIDVTDTSTKKKKKISVVMVYQLSQKDIILGKGIHTSKYIYFLKISAAPGQYDKVFESKESLKKYSKVDLYTSNKKGNLSNAWGKKANIDKLKKSFETDGCKYYTKDDVIDAFWEHHENFLTSLDYGMTDIDTSLEDIGVNWKKVA